MEIYRSTTEAGYYKFIAYWDRDNDSLIWDVVKPVGELVHRGDDSCCLVEVIKSVYDDYTLMEAMELSELLMTEAKQGLEHELSYIDDERRTS